MKRPLLFVAAATVALAFPIAAQDLAQPACPASTIPQRVAQDGCQQAYDLFQLMAPQLGIALAGGNAILGQGGALGGIGHFSVGVRGNLISGQIPDVSNPGFTQNTTGAQRNAALPTKTQLLGFPTADGALGVFQGIPLGLTNVGGIDLLGSAAYVPKVTSGSFTITPSKSWQFGYGARVGLLQESLLVPGVSFTYLRRDLPLTTINAVSGNNTLTVANTKVNTTAWRVVASKSFIVLGLAAGLGKDKYDESADISANVNGTFNGIPVSGTASVPGTAQSLTRSNYFVDASLNMPLFKLVGEIGNVSGGTVQTYNSFSGGRADRSMVYYSVGLRLAF